MNELYPEPKITCLPLRPSTHFFSYCRLEIGKLAQNIEPEWRTQAQEHDARQGSHQVTPNPIGCPPVRRAVEDPLPRDFCRYDFQIVLLQVLVQRAHVIITVTHGLSDFLLTGVIKFRQEN